MSFDPSDYLARERPDVVDAQKRLRAAAGRALSPRERTLIQVALAATQRSPSLLSQVCDEADANAIEPEALIDAALCLVPVCGEAAVLEAITALVARYPELDDEGEAPLVQFGAPPPEIEDDGSLAEEPGEVDGTEVRLEDIPEEGGKALKMGGRAIVLFRSGDQVHAFDDSCPHQDAPMSGGMLEGNDVVCPWHGWRFDVETGHCDLIPEKRLVVHATEVEDGQVRITLSEEGSSD
ncbi:MAG: Rieske (2Fe-2S) protein [Planctomycetota bacterium]